ncbi:MAG: tetratricopeptide repeat protein [Pseudoflavonifractor sp.]|nr:tetratricopeptide repeat protein [Alloprevotella sp.]MCM1117560.1 tetratricopeptide repeat protein [Pseudoflavonifractor sp.]
MKLKSIVALAAAYILAGAGVINAQGYQDGVDNFNAGREDVAKTILTNTLSDPSTDKAVSLFYLGQIAFNENDIAGAEKLFTEGSQLNPLYAPNLVGLGQIALSKGDKKAAETLFKDAQKIDKKNAAITAQIARAYWNVDPAVYAEDIQKKIAEAYKTSKNKEAAVYVLEGDMAAKNDPGEAASKYEMAITMDDEKGHVNREAYVKYAQTYFRVNPKFAIARLEELNEKEPASALAQRELAEKYYDNNQFGSAYLTYKKYLDNPNHFQNDEQRFAGLAFSAKEYQESMDMANKVLAKDPQNPFMYRVLMLNNNALENYSAAEEAGRKLFSIPGAELIPNDYILYATALSDQKKYPEAIEVYQQAIAANPDNGDLLKNLASVYDSNGQGELAVETMKKYIDLGDASATDLFNMARNYYTYARQLPMDSPERAAAVDEGVKYIDQAIEKAPTSATLYRQKGNLYLALNDKPNEQMATAYRAMLDLLDADPDNKTKQAASYRQVYYLMGSYYAPIDKAIARDYFTKYLEIVPDDEAVKKTLESLQ